jgi:adenosylcobinamide amidohydrolase
MKVTKNPDGQQTGFEPPQVTLTRHSQQLQLAGNVVGMMTSAAMTSLRQVTISEQATEVTAVVTAGVSNAKRAGERAEWRSIDHRVDQTGTINVIIITNALLSPAAMVEAIVTVTEAKAVALEESGVISPQTGRLATGTGTDALAIVGGFGPPEILYCGKHVLFGEMLATATIQAITQALEQ